MPTMQIYGSNSGSTVNYDKSGQRYDKRVFIDKKLRDVLLEIYLRYKSCKVFGDDDTLILESRINHFDMLARVCERLQSLDVKHEISCDYEDFTYMDKETNEQVTREALRMYVEIPLNIDDFPGMESFLGVEL